MCKSRLFLCCSVALSLFGLPAFSQTPDKQTPAVETVCDPLKADGVTKGLYGLCVAFCEAKDSADAVATTASRGRRAAPRSSSGSGRVLANYNKMKKATDPDMPCLAPVAVPQPCPCWTAAEAGAIDGVLSNGSTATGWPAPSSNTSVCGVDPTFPYLAEMGTVDSMQELALIQAVELPQLSRPMNTCVYQQKLKGQIVVLKMLSIEAGTLTAEELAACKADVLARQAAMRVCQ